MKQGYQCMDIKSFKYAMRQGTPYEKHVEVIFKLQVMDLAYGGEGVWKS